MLGVSIGNDLSVSQHVQRLVTSSAQASYALRVLHTRGLDDAALQHVYRATVVARLTYAASAWRDLASTSDLQRINSVVDCARRHGYCPADLPSFEELCDAADDELFSKTVRTSNHVLHTLLPPPSTNLRPRTHSLQLPGHATHLMDCTFNHHPHALQRHTSSTWLNSLITNLFFPVFIIVIHSYIHYCIACVLSSRIKRILYCIVLY